MEIFEIMIWIAFMFLTWFWLCSDVLQMVVYECNGYKCNYVSFMCQQLMYECNCDTNKSYPDEHYYFSTM